MYNNVITVSVLIRFEPGSLTWIKASLKTSANPGCGKLALKVRYELSVGGPDTDLLVYRR